MADPPVDRLDVVTPAFVYDPEILQTRARALRDVADRAGCKHLFTLKPFSLVAAMELLVPSVDGFSASSLFEARLARGLLGGGQSVHLTTPGFRDDEIDAVADLCDCLAFNSIGQFARLAPRVGSRASCGLRINPQLPFVQDDRYNPCRKHSKLGAPLAAVTEALANDPQSLSGVEGIHFHSNCDCRDLGPLHRTVEHLCDALGDWMQTLRWINLGGGYLYADAADHAPFIDAVSAIRERFNATVYVEPGAAICRASACLVASVIDLLESDGKTVAVLDTTVNHMSEVFEYQWSPPVAGAVEKGPHRYILAGCSCLAGDLFGEHAFDAPLQIGSQVVFPDAGSYTMVKWHWFNGINLPNIYARRPDGGCELKRQYGYDEFAARYGDTGYAAT